MANDNFNSSNSLRYAGDVNIEECTIYSSRGVFQNVRQQVMTLIIYEDIFSPFITGSIVLRDSLDLHNVFPLIGEEVLKLKVSTPSITGAVIDEEFQIYKMSDKMDTSDRTVMYELNFISREAIIDQNKKISKVYAGKISDIVPKFLFDQTDGLETKKKMLIENTRNTIKYVSPYWGPIKNLTFLSENAISETQSPSFLFFENRDGFNFRSIENLYKGKPVQEFIHDNYTRDSFPGGGNVLNIDADYKRIATVVYADSFNYIDRLRGGMYSSKLISYDSTKKTYTVKNYDIKSRYGYQTHLNEYPSFTENVLNRSNALHILFPKAFETFTSFGDTTNAKIIQERISFLKLAENQKLQIKVAGRFDYTVGQVCNVTLYKKRPTRAREIQADMVDKILSGNYLIAAINHQVTSSGHDCYIELIKDSNKRVV